MMRYSLFFALALAAFGLCAQEPDTIGIIAPTSFSLCYTDNMDSVIIFESAGPLSGAPLFMKICAGYMAPCCDRIRLFDGPDVFSTLLYQNIGGEDLEGILVAVPSGMLTLQIESDGTNSCATDNYTPLSWAIAFNPDDLECLPMAVEAPRTPSFNIYPSPADAMVAIALPSLPSGDVLLQILDLTGRSVVSGLITATRNEVDTRSLAGGTYLAEITSMRGRYTQRFQVVH